MKLAQAPRYNSTRSSKPTLQKWMFYYFLTRIATKNTIKGLMYMLPFKYISCTQPVLSQHITYSMTAASHGTMILRR